MATIIKTVEIDAPADAVWDAVADFGAVHTRFAPGFVTNVELIPGARMVTFGNGMVAKELFLGCDHDVRRLAYSVRTETFTHHSASFQVSDLGAGRSRLTWIADVLPDSIAPTVAGMMEAGIAVAKETLGRVPA
ncbi:MAG: SRPBCC family protein [Phenylobacterium sp.]|uniref:SRPBCC family protein n=1 Tax=Phenylobacterium sp. TaxID=1871053 RepID=UPI00120CA984|nr:SRPBCC family protein [Phenylobacterium sp.]TAJ69093.1 MAG: SRPBCC family protein [Phenylobacterium sp.]